MAEHTETAAPEQSPLEQFMGEWNELDASLRGVLALIDSTDWMKSAELAAARVLMRKSIEHFSDLVTLVDQGALAVSAPE